MFRLPDRFVLLRLCRLHNKAILYKRWWPLVKHLLLCS